MNKMKRIDFENGSVTGNILGATLPMLVAQIFPPWSSMIFFTMDRPIPLPPVAELRDASAR